MDWHAAGADSRFCSTCRECRRVELVGIGLVTSHTAKRMEKIMASTSEKSSVRQAFREAVAHLEGRDESVTYESVRSAMGGVGSYQHIAPLMKACREAKKHPMQPTPATVEERAKEFVQALWNTAHGEAAIEIERCRGESDLRCDDMNQDLETAMGEIKRLESDRDDLVLELSSLRDIVLDVRSLERQVEDQKGKLMALRLEADLERAKAEAQALRAAELFGEIKVLRTQVHLASATVRRDAAGVDPTDGPNSACADVGQTVAPTQEPTMPGLDSDS